MCGG
ncbi:hypothetical protein YPPY91_4395, partial [Yersinia pestis PY-91]|jgi:hypothetical protein